MCFLFQQVLVIAKLNKATEVLPYKSVCAIPFEEIYDIEVEEDNNKSFCIVFGTGGKIYLKVDPLEEMLAWVSGN